MHDLNAAVAQLAWTPLMLILVGVGGAVALTEAHMAFVAGWEAARGKSFEGGPLR